MSAQILSSAGLGTEKATITAIKDRNGAINWCRRNYDYSVECVDKLKDTGPAPGKVTLHANCKTKRFTDFWGRNLEVLDDDILNLETEEKLPLVIRPLLGRRSRGPLSNRFVLRRQNSGVRRKFWRPPISQP